MIFYFLKFSSSALKQLMCNQFLLHQSSRVGTFQKAEKVFGKDILSRLAHESGKNKILRELGVAFQKTVIDCRHLLHYIYCYCHVMPFVQVKDSMEQKEQHHEEIISRHDGKYQLVVLLRARKKKKEEGQGKSKALPGSFSFPNNMTIVSVN